MMRWAGLAAAAALAAAASGAAAATSGSFVPFVPLGNYACVIDASYPGYASAHPEAPRQVVVDSSWVRRSDGARMGPQGVMRAIGPGVYQILFAGQDDKGGLRASATCRIAG